MENEGGPVSVRVLATRTVEGLRSRVGLRARHAVPYGSKARRRFPANSTEISCELAKVVAQTPIAVAGTSMNIFIASSMG